MDDQRSSYGFRARVRRGPRRRTARPPQPRRGRSPDECVRTRQLEAMQRNQGALATDQRRAAFYRATASHLVRTIEILEPTLCIMQGASIYRDIACRIATVREDRCEPRGREVWEDTKRYSSMAIIRAPVVAPRDTEPRQPVRTFSKLSSLRYAKPDVGGSNALDNYRLLPHVQK